MSNSPFIIDVTEENFEAVVIEGSKTQPVLVDFWAPWCNPCQTLIPIVSKLAEEFKGQFILAKINTEEQQQLAQSNDIKSLPTVKLYKDGVAIDAFMGALPESEVKAFIEKHLEKQDSPLYDKAMQAYTAGDTDKALELLNQALVEDPNNGSLKMDIANVLFHIQDFEGSLSVINSMSTEQQREFKSNELLTQIKMKQSLVNAPAHEELEQRIKDDENDLDAHILLSNFYASNNNFEAALDLLLHVMRKDRTFNDDAARKGLISLFDLLTAEHPLTKTYRKKMFSLMH